MRRWGSVALGLMLSWTAVPVAAQPVTVRMIEFDRIEERAWQRAVVAAFHDDQSDIRVDLVGGTDGPAVQRVITLLAAGIPVHIAYGDPEHSISWGRQGIVRDLEPLFQRDFASSPFVHFSADMLNLHTAEGRRFGIPLDLQVQAFFYAQRPFDEAGIAYPDASWTWDTVADVAPNLTLDRDGDREPDRWGMRDPQYISWWPIIWHHGGHVVDDPQTPTRFTGDSIEFQEGMQWIYEMIHDRVAMAPFDSLNGSTAQNLVMDQNIAMAIGNSLYLQQAIDYAAETPFNVAPLPSGPYGNAAASNALGWSVFEAAGDHEAAWEVIKYFSDTKAMQMSVDMRGTLPPHLEVARDVWMRQGVPSDRHVFLDAIATARSLPVLYDNAWGSVYRNTRHYWHGRMTLAQAIENMRVDIETWISDL